jgi:hypothetical protein
MNLATGQRVDDRVFGPATVVRATVGGYLISLDYPEGLQIERPHDQLVLQGSEIGGQAVLPTMRSESRLGGRQGLVPQPIVDVTLRARLAVDALRFGVVPPSEIPALTLGYGELEAWVVDQLPAANEPPRAAAVYGVFGSGKSHTMAAIREIGRRRGYLVMSTEINGIDISLTQPRELLASLLGHLVGDGNDLDGSAPLLQLVRGALEATDGRPLGSRTPRMQQAIVSIGRLITKRRFDELEDAVERLLGSDPALNRTQFKALVRETLDWDDYVSLTYDGQYSPTPLVSYSPVDSRPYDFAQALLGYAAIANRCGFEGVIVTVDELEVEHALATGSKWQKLVEFVAAMRSELTHDEPPGGGLVIFFAAVHEDTLEHDVVKLIVETTPGEPYVLTPWDDDDLVDLARRIHGLYSLAYGSIGSFDARDAVSVIDRLDELDIDETGAIRAFIKTYVSRLDVAHGPPYR